MSANENEKNSSLGITLFASVAGILLFALILWLTYLPTHSTQVDATLKSQREQQLVETKAKATETLNNYAMISSQDGIVRIPIEQAMELTVETYQQ